MDDRAYGDMLAAEHANRTAYRAKVESIEKMVEMFVIHLYHEHSLGYRQIGKRLSLKWTDVKRIVGEKK